MKHAYLFSFDSKDSFQAAILELEKKAHVHFEAYSSHDLVSAEDIEARDGLNFIKIAGGIGAISGLLLAVFGQWYANVIDMPLNIGGRPLNSWPAFIPVSWVFTVLCTGLFTFSGFIFQNRFPKPYHLVFSAESYDLSKNFYSILIFSKNDEPGISDDFILSLGKSLKPISWEKIP